MYHTYIIYSASLNKYYVGSCADLDQRLNDHATGHSNFTKPRKPWGLVWSSVFETRKKLIKTDTLRPPNHETRIPFEIFWCKCWFFL